jgi:prolyl 4-hydroxylase
MSQAANDASALLAAGRTAQAIQCLETAAAADDADAMATLATWLLIGNPMPRDLSAARHWFARAAHAGHEWAALTEIALTANGTGASAATSPAERWMAALNLLDAAAAHFPVAAEHLALVHAMDLDSAGYPAQRPDGETLLTTPAVRLHQRLLTPDECAHIALAAQELLEPSQVADPATGQMIDHPIRTSDAAVIGPTRESLPLQALQRRIAAFARLPVDNGESLTVLRYRPGQQYRRHLDTLPRTSNQRVATVIVYLNEGYSGGETRFSESGLTIAGRGGDALFFANVDQRGQPDTQSAHAGLPVKAGVKWVATRWIRAATHDVWNPR